MEEVVTLDRGRMWGCQSLTEKVTFEHKFKEAREVATWLSGARAAQAVGTASAKSLRQANEHYETVLCSYVFWHVCTCGFMWYSFSDRWVVKHLHVHGGVCSHTGLLCSATGAVPA